MKNVSPVNKQERIHSLDLIRGVAVLGILIMNITSFSQIGIAYLNPNVGAGLEGLNGLIFAKAYLLADMKFMSIFSILFGAGVVLFAERITSKGMKPAGWHYTRMFWLMLFGFIHAYLIWMGDILVAYAICGSVVFLLRNLSYRALYIIGAILFIIPVLFSAMTYYGMPPDQLEKTFTFYWPTKEMVENQTQAMLSSYWHQMPTRVKAAMELQTLVFAIEQFWRVMAMMILGIILFRKGILSGQREKKFYSAWILKFLPIGIALSAWGLYQANAHDWNGGYMMNIGSKWNYVGSAFTALGYIGLIVWISKSNFLAGLQVRLRAVGKMAFTNYIFMSVICTLIFNGHGLGYYMQVDRLTMMAIVFFVWIIMLILSPTILKQYRYGPLEWMWRKLTYWKV